MDPSFRHPPRSTDSDEFPEGADYEILGSGVLIIRSGNAIHLYSPGYWQQVLIDTGTGDQREEPVATPDDIRWQ